MNKHLSFLVLLCFSLIAMNAEAQDCPDTCSFYIPNALTPDCDGIDCDVLEIESNCSFTEFDFAIYNRWGQMIFETSNPKESFEAGDNKSGTYLWTLKGEFCNQKEVESTGYISIIR